MQTTRRKTPLFLYEAFTMKKFGFCTNIDLSILCSIFFVFILGCFIYGHDLHSIAHQFSFFRLHPREISENSSIPSNPLSVSTIAMTIKHEEQLENQIPAGKAVGEDEDVELPPEDCDLFTGEWIFDDVSRPLYGEDQCESLSSQVTCLRNGRQESLYQNWKWSPKDCSLPKFKPKLLLRKLRNKRVMYVGDSLNRNQWESMVCLLKSGTDRSRTSFSRSGSSLIYRFQDYNATVEFYWAPFLVESNSDDPTKHSILNRTIMPGSINKHGNNWKDVDYLIFNTYIWWMNTLNIKVQRGSIIGNLTRYDEVERPVAYGSVLRTWAKWVDQNLDPDRTIVFFMGASPLHLKCAKETIPFPRNISKPLNVGTDRRLVDIITNVTRSMRFPIVHFLDITDLSEYRKDAHTSVYTVRQGRLITDEEKADPATFADCIHWCLPGLPDTWNELVYTRIISSS